MESLDELLSFAKEDELGCLVWQRAIRTDGYGAQKFNGKSWGAHRLALFLATDELGEVCMHSCDNPLCINPSHLQWGTHSDNVADKVSKGRQARGASVLGKRATSN